jgi:hypothetical protein
LDFGGRFPFYIHSSIGKSHGDNIINHVE